VGHKAGVVPPDAQAIDVVRIADYYAGLVLIVQAHSSAKK